MNKRWLVIPAYKLAQYRVKKFFSINMGYLKKHNIIPVLVVAPDDDYKIKINDVVIIQYPNDVEYFSIGRISNFGIKSISKWCMPNTLVIKSDIDMHHTERFTPVFTPSNIISFSVVREVLDENCNYIHNYEYSKPNPSYGVVTTTVRVWNKIKGFDERLFGWGVEDLYNRSCLKLEPHNVSRKGTAFYLPHQNETSLYKYPVKDKTNSCVVSYEIWDEDDWGTASYDDFDNVE